MLVVLWWCVMCGVWCVVCDVWCSLLKKGYIYWVNSNCYDYSILIAIITNK